MITPRPLRALLLLALLTATPAVAAPDPFQLEDSYRFLVSGRDQGGILYTATAGSLKGKRLPLSYHDSPAYWGEHVCAQADCTVIDSYDPAAYTLLPQKTPAGDLQTERINTHNGANIYDAATWQIAVMLGSQRNRHSLPGDEDVYSLVSNQNLLLAAGHSGDSQHPLTGETRAVSSGPVFVYNGQRISEPQRAYSFRMLPRTWLSRDPLTGTPYSRLITTTGLPASNPAYQPGLISWTDWKPITGENAWAFLIGPLQAAAVRYDTGSGKNFVPLSDPAIGNALAVLPTFAAMQAPIGAVYYAPAGTVANRGDQLVDPYFVAVENNISLVAGLRLLQTALAATVAHDASLTASNQTAIKEALTLCRTMLEGGTSGPGRTTKGLLHFLKTHAWQDGIILQGGLANKPGSTNPWQPSLHPKAVDVNTWGIAALGSKTVDQWFGFGAAFRAWQHVKSWGGYGQGATLWGVGFSDQDGNGLDAAGQYRQGILSVEWTAGAITMVRDMLNHYRAVPQSSSHHRETQKMITTLQQDEQSMLAAMTRLRSDNYASADFPGKPDQYNQLFMLSTKPYLYASRRYLIPFGWYANPIPSTCSTAWMVMVANRYNPFLPGGGQR